MEVKWVCDNCDSVNIAEEAPHMRCFVCDKERSTEPLIRPGAAPERDVGRAEPVPVGKPAAGGLAAALTGLKDRIMGWWRSLRPAAVPSTAPDAGAGRTREPERAPASGEIIGWDIDLSPDTSGEAFVRATPVLDTVRRPVSAPTLPGERPAALPAPGPEAKPEPREPEEPVYWSEPHDPADPAIWPVSPDPDPAPADPEKEMPWPEHRIRLAKETLLARGFVRTERATLNGVKGYMLTDRTGKERFLTLANMKMMGFAVDG